MLATGAYQLLSDSVARYALVHDLPADVCFCDAM